SRNVSSITTTTNIGHESLNGNETSLVQEKNSTAINGSISDKNTTYNQINGSLDSDEDKTILNPTLNSPEEITNYKCKFSGETYNIDYIVVFGDGNCFYHSIGYGIYFKVKDNEDLKNEILKKIESYKEEAINYESEIGDFDKNFQSFEKRLNEKTSYENSDGKVWENEEQKNIQMLFRQIAYIGYLQNEDEDIENAILSLGDKNKLGSFFLRDQADQPQIILLCQALDIECTIYDNVYHQVIKYFYQDPLNSSQKKKLEVKVLYDYLNKVETEERYHYEPIIKIEPVNDSQSQDSGVVV
ncbi:MAG: hypothetical protein MHPSP_003687, partial [Paramarteilia canceri]